MNWQITKLLVVDLENMPQAIVAASYKCGDIIGQTTLNNPSPQNFVGYSNLTEEQVAGWVKEALGSNCVADIECAASGQCFIKQPTSAPLPWENN